VRACLQAKIAKAEIVHIDASLIRADVSWDSLVARHVEAVTVANPDDEDAERRSRKTGKYKKASTTDPDATMATNGRNRRFEPSFKQHTAVDDLAGVVLDVVVTTGEVNEGQVLESQIDVIRGDHRRGDPDRHGGRRLCLRQDLRRPRATRHRRQ
jgi:hypothetical protein